MSVSGLFVCFLHACLCTIYMLGAHGGQNMALDPPPRVIVIYEWSRGCWDLNSGFLQKQQVTFTADPFLQPLEFAFYDLKYI